jgi:hypothetical protein
LFVETGRESALNSREKGVVYCANMRGEEEVEECDSGKRLLDAKR